MANAGDGWRARGRRIGWLDKTRRLLEPAATYAGVQKLTQAQKVPLSITPRTLWKRMTEYEVLASCDTTRGKNVMQWSIAGQRRYVLHLPSSVLALT